MKKINYYSKLLLISIIFFSCKNSTSDSNKESIQKTKKINVIPEKFYGNFSAGVETEGTTTGMASISYYFTINEKGVYLETNTYHEPIRCNGKYQGKMNNSILELFYAGTEIYCTKDNSNFQIKIDEKKFYVQGLGGEGTINEWIEMKRK